MGGKSGGNMPRLAPAGVEGDMGLEVGGLEDPGESQTLMRGDSLRSSSGSCFGSISSVTASVMLI